MGQEGGKKWIVAVELQPIYRKSDKLQAQGLGYHHFNVRQ